MLPWKQWFTPRTNIVTFTWCAETAATFEDFQGVVRFRAEDEQRLRNWEWASALPDYCSIAEGDEVRREHEWIKGRPHLVTRHTLEKLKNGGAHWIYSEVSLVGTELQFLHLLQGYTDHRSETLLLCHLASSPYLKVEDWSFGDYRPNRRGPHGRSSRSLLNFLLRRTPWRV